METFFHNYNNCIQLIHVPTFKHYVNTEKSLRHAATIPIRDLIRRFNIISDGILTSSTIAKSFNLHLNNHFDISNPTVINFTGVSPLIASAYRIATKSFPFSGVTPETNKFDVFISSCVKKRVWLYGEVLAVSDVSTRRSSAILIRDKRLDVRFGYRSFNDRSLIIFFNKRRVSFLSE